MIKFTILVLFLIPLGIIIGRNCWELWTKGEQEERKQRINKAVEHSKELNKQAKAVRKANPAQMKKNLEQIRRIDDIRK